MKKDYPNYILNNLLCELFDDGKKLTAFLFLLRRFQKGADLDEPVIIKFSCRADELLLGYFILCVMGDNAAKFAVTEESSCSMWIRSAHKNWDTDPKVYQPVQIQRYNFLEIAREMDVFLIWLADDGRFQSELREIVLL